MYAALNACLIPLNIRVWSPHPLATGIYMFILSQICFFSKLTNSSMAKGQGGGQARSQKGARGSEVSTDLQNHLIFQSEALEAS